MASLIALRALVGAGLGLGALDLVWINAALAPRLVHREAPATPPVKMTVTHAASEASAPVAAAVAAPSEVPASPAEPVTKRVYFDTSSAVIDAQARKNLARIVELAGPSATFVLEGHADYRGAESLNVTLSKDRALAVEQQLLRLGIDRARIRVGYAGESQATTNLQRDRRVDIQITGGTR